MHVWLLLFIGDVHLLIMPIDLLAMIILLTLTSMFTSLDCLNMLIPFVMYYFDPFLACYFYCTFILFILFSLSFCVNISDIPMHYMTACCMTTFLLCDYVVCL